MTDVQRCGYCTESIVNIFFVPWYVRTYKRAVKIKPYCKILAWRFTVQQISRARILPVYFYSSCSISFGNIFDNLFVYCHIVERVRSNRERERRLLCVRKIVSVKSGNRENRNVLFNDCVLPPGT